MTTFTFQTPNGAEVKLTALNFNGVNANVNGKPHTSSSARFVSTDSETGPHVALAGRVRAQVKPEDVARVAEFFRATDETQAAQRANYKLSDAERSAALASDMERRYSKH